MDDVEPAAAVGDHRAGEGDLIVGVADLQQPVLDGRAAAVIIVGVENERPGAGLGQAAAARDIAAKAPVSSLIEGHIGIVHDAALQAVGVTLQDAAADRRPEAVAVGAGENDLARAQLGQRAAAAGDVAGIGPGEILLEDQAGRAGHVGVALQAGGVALQRAGFDRGAAGIVVDPRQHQRAVARLGQSARAGDIAL